MSSREQRRADGQQGRQLLAPCGLLRGRFGLQRASLKAALLVACLMSGSQSSLAILKDQASEYQVKALFIYNFAKFVEWPEGTFATPRGPVNVCIVGEDPFGSELERAVKGKTINNRELSIVRTSRAQNLKLCQIVFVGASDRKQAREIIEMLGTASVLTVGDMQGFAKCGGMINFTMEDHRVRFEINMVAAERAHLRISAKLLSLAKSVIQGGGG